jgi:hypothetical protein
MGTGGAILQGFGAADGWRWIQASDHRRFAHDPLCGSACQKIHPPW